MVCEIKVVGRALCLELFSSSSSSQPCSAVVVNAKLKKHISKSALLKRHVASRHERPGNTHCSSLSSAALFI